jgi:MFS family permease
VLPPTGQREERDWGWQQPGTAAGGDAEELSCRETLGNRLDKRTGDPMSAPTRARQLTDVLHAPRAMAKEGGLHPFGVLVLLAGAFLPIADFFIVNVALPTIDRALHASGPTLELIVAGYGTAYAAVLVLGGRLGDRYGRHRLFEGGLIMFILASLACGLAPTIWVLIGARIVQGAAAAMLVPQVLATVHATLEGERKARALALYGATSGLAAVVGQLGGGILVDANIAGTSWRPIFLINIPLGLILLAIARQVVPATRSQHPVGIDLPGTVLFGATLIALLVPLTEGRWPQVSMLDLAGPLALIGAGQSMLFTGLFRIVLADLPAHHAGIGGGTLITLQQSGLALGVATLGTLYLALEPDGIAHAFAAAIGLQLAIVVLLVLATRALPSFSTASTNQVIADA